MPMKGRAIEIEVLVNRPGHAAARKNLDFVLATKADSPRRPGASANP